MSAVPSEVAPPAIRIDIGCGKNKKPGFYGVDLIDFDGVDMVADVRQKTWSFTKAPSELHPRLKAHDSWKGPASMEEWVYNPPFELPDSSVDEAHCSHFLEHLTNLNDKWERVHFFNELHRVLKPGAKCQIILPHWASNRYYGDPTHKEPFSEMGFYYLSKEWRAVNAPHADSQHSPNGYACDFQATWGYSLHQAIQARNPEYQMHALTWFKEAAQDIIATITCVK